MKTLLGPRLASSARFFSIAPNTVFPSLSSQPRYQSPALRCRNIQTSSPKELSATFESQISVPASHPSSLPSSGGSSKQQIQPVAPLSVLPLSQVLRTWMITSVSSSPRLMSMTTGLLRKMLASKGFLFSLDRNPVLRAILWHTFYKQFCAGETPSQVARECQNLRQQGYAGVILEYALEVLQDSAGNEEADVAGWRKGLLDTVEIANPGDFVALKWSGMGSAAMNRMKKNELPTQSMAEAMTAVCQAAAAKNVALLPSAEETWTLDGYHSWCLYAQKRFNREGACVLYNTYQAYLKRAPRDLEKHLEAAQKDGYTLGVKVVRGAYLDTEQRSKIWSTIEETHLSYDAITSALLQKENNDFLATKSWPDVHVILATHNATSVKKAQALRQHQMAQRKEMVPLAFAQLQGMADEVSCSLLAAAKADRSGGDGAVRERVFKFTPWGPMYECLNYLLRRAAENKDAAGRTRGTRNAMAAEIWRRARATLGLTWY